MGKSLGKKVLILCKINTCSHCVFNNSIQTKMDRSVSSSESALSLKENDGQIFGGDALVLVFFRCDALPILLESGQVDIVQ